LANRRSKCQLDLLAQNKETNFKVALFAVLRLSKIDSAVYFKIVNILLFAIYLNYKTLSG